MVGIGSKSQWISKPPLGVGVNWSHPLASGLSRAFLFNDKGKQTFRDACVGDSASYSRSASDTKWGADHFVAGAEGGSPTFETAKANGFGATSITVAARWAAFGSNPHLESAPFGGAPTNHAYNSRYNNGSDIGFGLGITSSTAAVYVNSDGLGLGASGSFTATSGVPFTVVGTYKRDTGVATYGGTWSVYGNGRLLGSNNLHVGGSFAGTFSSVKAYMFKGSGANMSDKLLYWLYVWVGRALSAGDVAELQANPYAFMQPVRRRSFAFLDAGGGGATAFPHHYYAQMRAA